MNKLSPAYSVNGEMKRGEDMRKEADIIFSNLMETGEQTSQKMKN
jgi:hypothetical protein